MKALLFANTDWYLYHFRLSLAKALQEQGFDVVLLSPPGKYGPMLVDSGFTWIQFPLSRRGMNPFFEILTILRLVKIYQSIKPDIVHHFTIKCILYGSAAAKIIRIKKIINAVTGLGYLFMENNIKTALLRQIVSSFYRLALMNTWVIFQNPDDQEKFIKNKLVDKAHSRIIRGSGVDVSEFQCHMEPPGPPVVLLASRMLWSKGIADFVEAARFIRDGGVQARFVLVGDSYPDNPDSIPGQQLLDWQQAGAVEWWGWHDDMAEIMQKCHIFCLPSSYREGVPRALIEAAATCRPIVTNDIAGCREIVKDGLNGYLVPPKDPQALAGRILDLIQNPQLRSKMGKIGREIVIREYSDQLVISETLQLYPQNSL